MFGARGFSLAVTLWLAFCDVMGWDGPRVVGPAARLASGPLVLNFRRRAFAFLALRVH